LLGAVPRRGAGRLREIPGRVPSLAALPDACAFAPRCPRATEQCVAREPPLARVRPAHAVACVHPGAVEAAAV
jgi:peptide/nickel transport system ATP-binding protein